VRHRAAEARQDEGEREPGGVPGDGLQADGVSIKELAIVERFAAAGRGHQGDGLHRRNPGEARRLRILQTQLLTIPRTVLPTPHSPTRKPEPMRSIILMA